jgi:3-methyladenine DNA glycosylase AlkC
MVKTPPKPSAGEQGVPKETPHRNCLSKLGSALTPLLGKSHSDKLIVEIKRNGYFELGLLDQSQLIVKLVTKLGNGKKISQALLNSDSDKIRSIGVHVHFEHFKDDLDIELRSLKKTGSLPGTWTQETSQWVLKNVVHLHGLDTVLPLVQDWALDPDPTVRRVVVEALRPRGVWCKHIAQLKADPSPIKPLLESVLDDKSDYVRKAVANNLNDIAKSTPDLLCDWIESWKRGTISSERRWIISRALRSLIRDNHPRAQKLMGLGDASSIEVIWKLGTPKTIAINASIPFDFELRNRSAAIQKVRLQLLMHGPGKNDKPRVAKYLLGEASTPSRGEMELAKKIKFAHKNFVPKLPGVYRLQVLCNGRLVGERSIKYLGRDL